MHRKASAARVGRGLVLPVALLTAAFTGGTTRAGSSVGAQPAAQESDARAAHREEVGRLTADGGVMITSNARYAAEDRGQTHYGQYFEALPGGLDARGCLWGERDGELLGVYWYFFSGWDPEAGRGFFYQSSPAGRVGFGHGGSLGEDGHWLEQRFEGPGMAPRSRHENHWFGTDSVKTRSYTAEIDGEWTARRSYTWIRQPGRAPPC